MKQTPYYQRFGEGKETLILLHSGGMAGIEWQPQIPILSKRYRLLVPDLPGHGKTLLSDERLTIATLGESVLAMMDDAKVEKAHICGSSMGAATAMWLNLNYPEKVKKAIFYRISYQKNAETYQQTRNMSDPAYWKKFGLHKWLSELHFPQGGEDAWERVIASVSEALDPAESEHAHTLDAFAKIKNPVLLVVGDRDPVAPLEDILALYRTITNSGLWVLPYADHITATNTWRSQAFAEEILRFLSRSEK